jgi:hypothetical protein
MRHSFGVGNGSYDRSERFGVDADGCHAILAFQCNTVHGDRRRAGASMPHRHDRGSIVLVDFAKELWIIFRVNTGFARQDCSRFGQMFGEPHLHLLQQFVAIDKMDIDEINRFAV